MAGRTQMRREGGNYPKTVNEDNWPRLFKRLCGENGLTANDVDQLLFTQISKPSIAIAAGAVRRCHSKNAAHHHGEIRLHRFQPVFRWHWTMPSNSCKIKRGDLFVVSDSIRTWMEPSCSGDLYDHFDLLAKNKDELDCEFQF